MLCKLNIERRDYSLPFSNESIKSRGSVKNLKIYTNTVNCPEISAIVRIKYIYKISVLNAFSKFYFFQYNGSENFTEPVLTLHIQMRHYQ